jgi:rubrerythrin
MATENNALKFVLDFEAKGVGAYLKLAAKTGNALGKKLFYSLAAEEIQHAKKADEFYGGISKNSVLTPSGILPLEITIKDFFEKMEKAAFKKGSENVEGYELAMELERKGYEAYNNFLKNSKTEEEKAFFKWILNEEKEHLSAIANVYYYLTGTGDWLQEEEGKTWNWMNL